ncbi:MAG TPA: Sua5/YciO/YrdC/YwlC family protein [Candidatus Binatia bacterium]|nr:Sua5/YciO/YrdC/YwlC family protein [Candidatus Binatia bacterium]
MDVISKDEFVQGLNRYLARILDGQLFIHPLDSLYGIGCDATNSQAVLHVREAKGRFSKPFCIIAPSKHWIRTNCVITHAAERWLNRLPGPEMLVLELKRKYAVAPEVNPTQETIAVRMPAHWFTKVAQVLGRPLVTTTANHVHTSIMTSQEDLDPEIAKHIDFMIYEGVKKLHPTPVIELTDSDFYAGKIYKASVRK